MAKLVRSLTDEEVEMDPEIFRGSFDHMFSTAVLNKLNIYAAEFKSGVSPAFKPGEILSKIIIAAIENDWDKEFVIKMTDRVIAETTN